MKKLLCFVVCALLFGATSYTQQAGGGQAGGNNRGGRFVADEVLIKFRPGVDEQTKNVARSFGGASRKKRLRANASGEVEVSTTPFTVAEAIDLLQRHPAVLYAEPNWVYTHQATSNDPFYTGGSLWGMYGDLTSPANQWGSQAGEAWASGHTGSSTVYVGVIDEGIDFNHPDLAANIWTNPFDPVDGVDNDGNGYVDDTHGWDFFGNDNSVYDGSPLNGVDRHGTHVSGTIGGVGGNGAGVAGMNWNVTIISGKFLSPSGGTTADAVEAINYMTDLKVRHGLNLVATNNSWGGGGYSVSLHAAINRAAKAGILFVAAAGNGNFFGNPINNDVFPNYPSNYDTTLAAGAETGAGHDAVIAVAAITSTGLRSSFSNYGLTTVDLGAPGSGIISTTPNGGYSSFSGTSMATPHVAGAAALYKSINPGASASSIKQKILSDALPTASLAGITVTGARLNVGGFGPPPPPPAAPSGLVATAASSSQINLAWLDNSSNESGFKIERCTGGGCTNFAQIATVGANATGFSNTGLLASTTYRYQVRAYNGGGNSSYADPAAATTQDPPPPAPPLAPSSLSATAVSSSQINLSWTDNATNETGFKIERCQGAGCTSFAQIATVGANATSYGNTGLAGSTAYRYRVRANNADGDSGYSNEAEAPTPAVPAVPVAPSGLTATPGPGKSQIRLSWLDNANNETGFKIERCAGQNCTSFAQIATAGANATTYQDGGLQKHRVYRYRVRASNAAGDSYSNIASAKAP